MGAGWACRRPPTCGRSGSKVPSPMRSHCFGPLPDRRSAAPNPDRGSERPFLLQRRRSSGEGSRLNKTETNALPVRGEALIADEGSQRPERVPTPCQGRLRTVCAPAAYPAFRRDGLPSTFAILLSLASSVRFTSNSLNLNRSYARLRKQRARCLSSSSRQFSRHAQFC